MSTTIHDYTVFFIEATLLKTERKPINEEEKKKREAESHRSSKKTTLAINIKGENCVRCSMLFDSMLSLLSSSPFSLRTRFPFERKNRRLFPSAPVVWELWTGHITIIICSLPSYIYVDVSNNKTITKLLVYIHLDDR